MVTKSLIQQRISLERARLVAVLTVVGGSLLVVASGVSVVWRSSSPSIWQWWPVIFWCAFVCVGVVRLVRVRRRRLAFESEHGRDAGKQKPV